MKNVFMYDSSGYFDYDRNIDSIDREGFIEFEKQKIAYYEDFLSKRKEYIEHKNTAMNRAASKASTIARAFSYRAPLSRTDSIVISQH